MASSLGKNGALHLFKLPYDPSYFFLKLKDNLISSYFMGLLKWYAPRLRGISFIGHCRARKEGIE